MFLTNADFEMVVRKTPMIAIDLCIINDKSILLGKRLNPPAKNYYFVPGGRIRKSESINLALKRIMYEETGREIKKEANLDFMGIYEHFYEDNFKGNNDFDSHYVVIAYKLDLQSLSDINSNFTNKQHSEYLWFDMTKTTNLVIHENTKVYIKKIKSI
tara:strand:- start:636 stop:1109 length:474 start_codon:yes stop_codon:yes gene_type:complete